MSDIPVDFLVTQTPQMIPNLTARLLVFFFERRDRNGFIFLIFIIIFFKDLGLGWPIGRISVVFERSF